MKESALLIIDLINDLIHPKGAIASNAQYAKDYHLIEHTNQAIEWARKNKIPIIFVIVGFSEGYREIIPHSPLFSPAREKGALQLGTWGCKIHDEIATLESDLRIIKHSVSPFYGTELDLYLRRQGIKQLIVGGVSTDMAIQSVVREGHDLGYRMFICEEICGAKTREVHVQSIEMLQRLSKICKIQDLKGIEGRGRWTLYFEQIS